MTPALELGHLIGVNARRQLDTIGCLLCHSPMVTMSRMRDGERERERKGERARERETKKVREREIDPHTQRRAYRERDR